jgi:hypothetical protein
MMIAFRITAVVLGLSLLSSCASKTQVRDVAPNEANWMEGRRTVADGSKLKMIFERDSEALKINRIDYKVYEGELYVWPVRESAAFVPVEFTLDTSALKLHQPWQNHVYWVAAANWDAPVIGRVLNPSPLGDRVERLKADVVASKSN